MNQPPLVVDLDGTLIHTDMLHHAAVALLRDKPLHTLMIPVWLGSGKVVLKRRLAHHTRFDPALLPYNEALLTWLEGQQSDGRRLILETAAAIADHLGLFDEVIATGNGRNLKGASKARELVSRFGEQGFDYAGNGEVDIAVWRHARRAILVNASDTLAARVEAICQIDREFTGPERRWSSFLHLLRLHQWLKNLLLFVPFVAAHKIGETDAWAALLVAFFCFSFLASAVYVVNDLLDLESDRKHPRKRHRPLASGVVPLWVGVTLAPLLLIGSLLLSRLIPEQFIPWLILYLVLTTAYSLGIKRLLLLDCLTLAMLYTIRVVAGAAAVDMPLSFWLLAFSVFIFLCLAFVKRYAELRERLVEGKQTIHGRGYVSADAPLIQMLGICAGYAAVVVLALYLNSDAVLQLYLVPEMIWGAVPVTLFWISWMWLKAHRGEMHDDPLIFALKDSASLLSGVAFVLVLLSGTLGWSW